MEAERSERVLDALLELAAEERWEAVTLEAIALRAGVTLKDLRAEFDSRWAILAAYSRHLDEAALEALDPAMRDEAPRERLFDILFSRIEALKPHKAGIRGLARAAMRDPVLALALNRETVQSMNWMLAAADLEAGGAEGLVRAQALTLVWGRVLTVWLRDEDPGLARTMAELDRRLREAERAALRLERLRRLLPGTRRPPQVRTEPETAETADVEAHPS